MNIEQVLSKELSLTATLAELGFTHRPAPRPSHRKEILRDGMVIGVFNADECWEWLRDGCPNQSEVTE